MGKIFRSIGMCCLHAVKAVQYVQKLIQYTTGNGGMNGSHRVVKQLDMQSLKRKAYKYLQTQHEIM